MTGRTEVTDTEIAAAFAMLGNALNKKVKEQGRQSFVDPHHMIGKLDEAMLGLRLAIKNNSHGQAINELLEAAYIAVFGIASIKANERSLKKEGTA